MITIVLILLLTYPLLHTGTLFLRCSKVSHQSGRHSPQFRRTTSTREHTDCFDTCGKHETSEILSGDQARELEPHLNWLGPHSGQSSSSLLSAHSGCPSHRQVMGMQAGPEVWVTQVNSSKAQVGGLPQVLLSAAKRRPSGHEQVTTP